MWPPNIRCLTSWVHRADPPLHFCNLSYGSISTLEKVVRAQPSGSTKKNSVIINIKRLWKISPCPTRSCRVSICFLSSLTQQNRSSTEKSPIESSKITGSFLHDFLNGRKNFHLRYRDPSQQDGEAIQIDNDADRLTTNEENSARNQASGKCLFLLSFT